MPAVCGWCRPPPPQRAPTPWPSRAAGRRSHPRLLLPPPLLLLRCRAPPRLLPAPPRTPVQQMGRVGRGRERQAGMQAGVQAAVLSLTGRQPLLKRPLLHPPTHTPPPPPGNKQTHHRPGCCQQSKATHLCQGGCWVGPAAALMQDHPILAAPAAQGLHKRAEGGRQQVAGLAAAQDTAPVRGPLPLPWPARLCLVLLLCPSPAHSAPSSTACFNQRLP